MDVHKARQKLQQNPANHVKDTCTHVQDTCTHVRTAKKLLSSSLSPIPLFHGQRQGNFLINPKSAARPFFQVPISSGFAFLEITSLLSQTERGDLERRMTSQTLHPCTTDSRIQVPKCLCPFRMDLLVPFRRNAHWSNGGVARVGFSTRR